MNGSYVPLLDARPSGQISDIFLIKRKILAATFGDIYLNNSAFPFRDVLILMSRDGLVKLYFDNGKRDVSSSARRASLRPNNTMGHSMI